MDTLEEESNGALDFAQVSALSVISLGAGVAPAGKLFEETVQHLGPLERHLLFFSASSSLAAVRWLLRLGASSDACDSNGSTCLHVACRTGSVSVVCELMRHPSLLEAVDAAMWTPLHIASHMGRRKVVVELMRARATALRRTATGQTAMDLCLDHGTRELLLELHTRAWPCAPGARRQLVSQLACSVPSPESRLEEGWAEAVVGAPEVEDRIGVPSQCEPELFFVTPSPMIRHVGLHTPSAVNLGVRIFNLSPSYGVGFMVMAGLAENYTSALNLLLKCREVDKDRAGEFMGESLSVCHLLRFGLLDSFPLMHTGVIGALTVAFRLFRMPGDLEKVHRLVNSVAVVWWRKHSSLSEPCEEPLSEEIGGLLLSRCVGSAEALSQLMLSTVMLHWFLHGDAEFPSPGRRMSLAEWACLNAGLGELPERLQAPIYARVAPGPIPELMVGSGLLGSERRAAQPADEAAGPREAALRPVAAAKRGWLQVLHGALPSPAETRASDGALGELTAGARESAATSLGSGAFVTLSSIFLLFAATSSAEGRSAAAAPYAVVDVRSLRVAVSMELNTLTLEGIVVDSDGCDVVAPVAVAYLLPDARWRELKIDRMVLKAPSTEELRDWEACLARTRSNACSFNI